METNKNLVQKNLKKDQLKLNCHTTWYRFFQIFLKYNLFYRLVKFRLEYDFAVVVKKVNKY